MEPTENTAPPAGPSKKTMSDRTSSSGGAPVSVRTCVSSSCGVQVARASHMLAPTNRFDMDPL
eukprot:2434408-Pyramimonas_sp.AAC.2